MALERKVAVIGSGFVGQSWAMIYASAGYKVSMYDISSDQLTRALEDIRSQLHTLEAEQLLRGTLTVEQQLELISSTSDLATAMKSATVVQESVFEDLEIKKEVFSQMDKFAESGQVLSSSTSCILPSDFTYHLKNRASCIVAHPTNPPYYCPAVEVVPSQFTNPETTKKMMAILEEVEQVPVLVKKEIFGFVLNRLQYAMIGEAMRLVKDGVCSVEGIDKIMSEGFGMRYAFLGPLAVAHLNAPNGFADYSQRYGPSIVKVQKDFGPVPSFTPEIVENIVTQQEKVIPGEKFLDAIEWRNDCLAKLAKIKKDNKRPK